MELGFMLTQRCNAQCTHCATSCGPHRHQALGASTVFALMDEAAQRTAAGEILDFSLTGGEPFMDLGHLIEVIRHGTSLGGTVGCVTNAYWASSDSKAEAIIARVREAGLTRLAASTSRYHQRYVPITRVKRALAAARSAGMDTLLKIAFSVPDQHEGLIERWAEFVGAERLQTFPLVAYLREGAELPPAHYARAPGLPEGTCPSPSLTVREDGAAYTCCTPGAFEPLLRVGNVFDQALSDIVDTYHFDPVLRVLRERGPIHFARHAIDHGQRARLRDGYANECDLCAHIVSDPVLASCAADSAQQYRRDWAARTAKGMRIKATTKEQS